MKSAKFRRDLILNIVLFALSPREQMVRLKEHISFFPQKVFQKYAVSVTLNIERYALFSNDVAGCFCMNSTRINGGTVQRKTVQIKINFKERRNGILIDE